MLLRTWVWVLTFFLGRPRLRPLLVLLLPPSEGLIVEMGVVFTDRGESTRELLGVVTLGVEPLGLRLELTVVELANANQ